MTLLASAENIENYLVGTALAWMLGGAFQRHAGHMRYAAAKAEGATMKHSVGTHAFAGFAFWRVWLLRGFF